MKKLKILFIFVGLFLFFYFVNVNAIEKDYDEKIEKIKIENGEVILNSEDEIIIFNFSGIKKKKEYDPEHKSSTKIAEEVLKENIETYKRMINKIYEKKSDKKYKKFYGNEHFDLDYVGFLLDRYLRVLYIKAFKNFIPINQSNLFCRYYRAFYSNDSKLFLNYYGVDSVDEETGLFCNSVGFKLSSEAIADGFFNLVNTPAVKKVFGQIIEFFVVFLDFYSVVDNYELPHKELPEWERPEFKEEGEYALIYPSCLDEILIKDRKIKENVKYEILNDIVDKNIKFNGCSEDLYKFYKTVYNNILKKEWLGFYKVSGDLYFELFNPEFVKNIRILRGVYDVILIKFNESVKNNELKLELLKRFKSFEKNEIDYLNSMPGVAIVKQIILIYIQFLKENKEKLKLLEFKDKLNNREIIENSEQKTIEQDEIYVTKHKYRIGIDKDIECFKKRCLEIRESIEYEIMKNKGNEGVEFNGDSEDLYKFYEALYNKFSKKEWSYYFKIYDDIYFKLFNPKMLKYIRVVNNDGLCEILLEYNEDAKFNESQLEFLEFLRSTRRSDISFFASTSGVAIVKQIILIYLECVEKNKERLNKLELEIKK